MLRTLQSKLRGWWARRLLQFERYSLKTRLIWLVLGAAGLYALFVYPIPFDPADVPPRDAWYIQYPMLSMFVLFLALMWIDEVKWARKIARAHVRQGLVCPICDYDLSANPSVSVCPECAAAIDLPAVKDYWDRRHAQAQRDGQGFYRRTLERERRRAQPPRPS